MEEQLESMRDALDEESRLRANWIQLDRAGIFVGSESSESGVHIDNDSVDWLVGDQVVATGTADEFIPKAIRLGDYLLAGDGDVLTLDSSPKEA